MSNDSTYQAPLEKSPPLSASPDVQSLNEYRAPALTPEAIKTAVKPDDCGCHKDKVLDQKTKQELMSQASRASRDLSGNKQFCQGDVVVPVYFTTERKPIRDKSGKITGFADEPNYVQKDGSVEVELTRGKIYQRAKVDRSCRATKGEVESIGWQTGRQCIGMKTGEIQTLSEDKYFAELNSSLEMGYTNKLDWYVPGYSIRFAGGIGQATEIELGKFRNTKRGDFKSDIQDACDQAGSSAHSIELYSWASNGHILGYAADDRNVKYSLVSTWPKEVQKRNDRIVGGPKNINLMVHSKFAEPAIESMWIRGMLSSCQGKQAEKFNKIILGASDYGLRTFAEEAKEVISNTKDLWAVVNTNDNVLKFSKFAHGETPLGLASAADVMKHYKQLEGCRIVNIAPALKVPDGYDPSKWLSQFAGHSSTVVMGKIANDRENDSSDGLCIKEVPGTNHLYHELTTDCSEQKK